MQKKYTDVSLPHGREQIIKMDILGMIHSAENPFDIIYHVAKYLEEESSEAGYAQNVLENMRSVYGLALKDVSMLKDELKDTEDRCHRIEEALKNEDFSEEEKARITLAITLHRKNAVRLREKIHLAETTGEPLYREKY